MQQCLSQRLPASAPKGGAVSESVTFLRTLLRTKSKCGDVEANVPESVSGYVSIMCIAFGRITAVQVEGFHLQLLKDRSWTARRSQQCRFGHLSSDIHEVLILDGYESWPKKSDGPRQSGNCTLSCLKPETGAGSGRSGGRSVLSEVS